MLYKELIDSVKKFLSIDDIDDKEIEKNLEIKKIVSFLMVFATTILTVLNLLKEFYIMALSTSVLTITFLICISLCSDRNNIKTINRIMSIVTLFIFSYYAISGQNDGFAILWISIVPIVSLIVVGIRYGVFLSLYFQIFLIVLFHTPLRDIISVPYNDTFMTRYPILYFVSFSISIYVTIKNERYKDDIKKALNYDKLTGLLNRDMYDEYIRTVNTDNKNLFIIKINGLAYVNNEFGHDAGNRLIKYAADYIRTVFADKYEVYKIDGSMFAVVLEESEAEISHKEKQLNNFIFRNMNETIDRVCLQVGVASIDETKSNSYKELEKLALAKIDKK